MASQSFAFEAGGEKRLDISWKGLYSNVEIWFDGRLIDTIYDSKKLSKGQEYHLNDGSTINVRLASKVFISPELQILRNGQPLPGSVSDPQTKFKNAYGIVYFIAGLNIVLGLISFLFNVELLRQMGIGFGSILFGLVYLVLGFFVQRRSSVALVLAIIIFALDGILGVFFASMQGYTPSGAGIVARIFLLIPMGQGFGAIKALRSKGV